MGTIRNFDKIKFRPFSLRVGDLKGTIFYTEDGMIKPFSNSKLIISKKVSAFSI